MPQTKIPLSNFSAMLPVAHALDAMGMNASELFAEFLLPLNSPSESRIPASAIYEMMETVAIRRDRPTLSSELALHMIEDTLQFYGLQCGEHTSLAELLTRLIVSQRQQYTSAPIRLNLDEDLATLSQHRTDVKSNSTTQVDCWEVTTVIEIIRRQLGSRWDAHRVQVTISSPQCLCSGLLLPEQSLQTWGKSGIQVTLPTEWLINMPDMVEVKAPIETSQPPPDDFMDSLYAALEPRIAQGGFSLEEAASYCGFGVRQFQSRLQDHGLNFLALQDDLRREWALREVETTTRSATDISSELGYSDPSAFSRAFKRWTGVAPEHYRDRLGDTKE